MHSEQDREIGSGLVDAYAADGIDEDVVAGGFDAAVPVQHGEQQREPLRIEPHREPAGHRALHGVDQCLDLHQQGSRALERGDDDGSRDFLPCCERNSADGLATPLSPRSVIANTPSSLAAPKRFLIARTSRKLECGSPSK